MKQAIKGLLLLALNNSALITFDILFADFCENPSTVAFFCFMLPLILWFITGNIIIAAYFVAKRHIKKGATKQKLLSYSFIDNSILLSTETIQKNGFHEIWRQEGKGHSIQILCFNNETGEFQAFDRFHWMDEPIVVMHEHYPDRIIDYGSPEGTYYKKDLWTPIKLHYTTEWLNEHVR